MKDLVQRRILYSKSFEFHESGIHVIEKSIFSKIEQNYYFEELNIGIEKKIITQGLPTLFAFAIIMVLSLYVLITNFEKLNFIFYFSIFGILFFTYLFFNVFHENYKKVFVISGSKSVEIHEENPDSKDVQIFIDQLNLRIKQSRVLQYNDLINSFEKNKYLKLIPINFNILITDKEYRFINYKISLLQRNLFLDDFFEGNGIDNFEEDNFE